MMKKILLKIAVIVMVCVLSLNLVACTILQDYKEVRSNLRDKNYYVSVGGRDEVIDEEHEFSEALDFLTGMLDYDVLDENEEYIEELHIELAEVERDLEKMLVAYDEDNENILIIWYFEDSTNAKEYYGLIDYLFELFKTEGVDRDYIDVSKDDLKYGVSGNVVYFGSKDALDAAK